MSGYPDVGDTSIPVVRDTDEVTVLRAKWTVADRARREQWTRDEIVQVLAALGLVASASGGKTNPTGRNIPPAVQQRRREANAASKRRAREQRKRNEEAS